MASLYRLFGFVTGSFNLTILTATWYQLQKIGDWVFQETSEDVVIWVSLADLQRRSLEEYLLHKWLFRLRHRQVCEALGEPDTPLFRLAMQLGWLNQVGVAVEDPFEKVYAFYHPTFEEYFAALAIDDWHFFLNHLPQNPT